MFGHFNHVRRDRGNPLQVKEAQIIIKTRQMFASIVSVDVRGWSKAYTVSSLLVQLQSFLFDLQTGYLTKGDKDRMRKTALAYSCTSHWACESTRNL